MKNKTTGNKQNTKRQLNYIDRREQLIQRAKLDCITNPHMDSSKNRIFDQENVISLSIPVVNSLTKEVHMSNTDEVLNNELFSHPKKRFRELHLTKQYSALIILPNGEKRKYIATEQNEIAAISEISQYVSAIEDAMGVSCLWKLEQSQAFYIRKKRIGLSQLERLKAQFKVTGKRIFNYLFEPAQG